MNISFDWLKKNLKGDPVIWTVVGAFSIWSILVVYSASVSLAVKSWDREAEYFLFKHSMLIFVSLFAMWLTHNINYKYYTGLSRIALLISVPLLIMAWQAGVTINEASRWLTIPVINQSFQPSDLAKLALIVNLANMLSKRQRNIEDFKASLLPILFWCGLICTLIALTDLSTAAMLFATCILLMFIGRVPVKYLMMLVLVGLLGAIVALSYGSRGGTAQSRLSDFSNFFSGGENIPFQLEQSYITIADGGLLGNGPGNSSPKNFLPGAYNDFVFPVIVGEYGLIAGFVVVFLYLVLLYRGMVTVGKSERAFGGLLSAGLSFALVLQTLLNIGVTVGVLPITGLPLPMLSMGGTSLIFTGIALGMILSVSRGEREEETGLRNVPKEEHAEQALA